MEKETVSVVIPVYKPTLDRYEEKSLKQCLDVLGGYPVTIIKPAALDVSYITERYPTVGVESFDNSYFKGIAGYNRLMMSEEFYERFSRYEYILIYQLDAYVFSDRLPEWCGKGYDYIGAPWLVRPIYNFPLLKLGSFIKHGLRRLAGKPDARQTYWKVGNGGLSLRKVDSHLECVRRLRKDVEEYLSHPGNHLYNEDVFFSVYVNKAGMNFSYPDWREALQFSFDKYPSLCYELNGNELPFGCHAWQKRKMRKFWMPIIMNEK